MVLQSTFPSAELRTNQLITHQSRNRFPSDTVKPICKYIPTVNVEHSDLKRTSHSHILLPFQSLQISIVPDPELIAEE